MNPQGVAPKKRGRPVAAASSDPDVNSKRARDREAQRRSRMKKMSSKQELVQDAIVGSVESVEGGTDNPPITDAELGFRMAALELPRDPGATERQQSAINVEEPDQWRSYRVWRDANPKASANRSASLPPYRTARSTSSSVRGPTPSIAKRSLHTFFRTVPKPNRLSSVATRSDRIIPPVTSSRSTSRVAETIAPTDSSEPEQPTRVPTGSDWSRTPRGSRGSTGTGEASVTTSSSTHRQRERTPSQAVVSPVNQQESQTLPLSSPGRTSAEPFQNRQQDPEQCIVIEPPSSLVYDSDRITDGERSPPAYRHTLSEQQQQTYLEPHEETISNNDQTNTQQRPIDIDAANEEQEQEQEWETEDSEAQESETETETDGSEVEIDEDEGFAENFAQNTPDLPPSSSGSEADSDDSGFATDREPSPDYLDHDDDFVVGYVADKLYEQLTVGFHGCSSEEHELQHEEHMAETDDHNGLDQVLRAEGFVSTLYDDTMRPERVLNQAEPTVAQWESLFMGHKPDSQTDEPMNVCLHESAVELEHPETAIDIDSFMGFASSLAVAKEGIDWQPVPLVKQNIQTDVHINADRTTSQLNEDEFGQPPPSRTRIRSKMLKSIPHIYFGRLTNDSAVIIYLLFPKLPTSNSDSGDDFIGLTKQQLQRWTDEIANPIIRDRHKSNFTQYLPTSYENALDNSRAKQKEMRKVTGANYEAQQTTHYPLRAAALAETWDAILERVQQPGMQDFGDPLIFFDSKNRKLSFKNNFRQGHPDDPPVLDLHKVLTMFSNHISNILSMDHTHPQRMWVDVAKETVNSYSRIPNQTRYGQGSQAHVYVWRPCCLSSYLKWISEREATAGKAQRFNLMMLRDATNMTVLTKPGSELRRGGLVYSQFYSSIKAITDPGGHIAPFRNEGLEELAIDPEIIRGIASIARGRKAQMHVLRDAFAASKKRLVSSTEKAVDCSYGVREEHRITMETLQHLQSLVPPLDQLQATAHATAASGITVTTATTAIFDSDEALVPPSPSPSPSPPPPPPPPHSAHSYAIWVIPTPTWLAFMLRHVDRLTSATELAIARCPNHISWEHTKVIAAFLRCLRFACDAHDLRRESALWWSRRDAIHAIREEDRIMHGLGFSNTMLRHGFCWMEPRIDWQRLVFAPPYRDSMLFGNYAAKTYYLENGGRVRDFLDISHRIDVALTWLKVAPPAVRSSAEQQSSSAFSGGDTESPVRRQIERYIALLIMQQLRVDTFTACSGNILPERLDDVMEANRALTYSYFRAIATGEDTFRMASGNRVIWKKPDQLVSFIFDHDDRARHNWRDRPCRKAFNTARLEMCTWPNREAVFRSFYRQLRWAVYEFHWVLPFATSQSLMQGTGGQRSLYSINVDRKGRPYFSPKRPRMGEPPRFPDYLGWAPTRWHSWLDMHNIPWIEEDA